jgi:hypothetical protein
MTTGNGGFARSKRMEIKGFGHSPGEPHWSADRLKNDVVTDETRYQCLHRGDRGSETKNPAI